MKTKTIYLLIIAWVFLYPSNVNAQSVVFNNVYNDYEYKKYSPNSETFFYNADYLHYILELKKNKYSFYGYSSNLDYFAWEDSILKYSYIVNLDFFGDTINTKRIDTKPYNIEGIIASVETSDNVYSVGVTSDTLYYNLDSINILFLKLDTNNNYILHKDYNLGQDNKAMTIKTNNNGATLQILSFADVDTVGINYDAFITTVDSNGNMISNIQIGGPLEDVLYAIEYLDNGNYLLCGYTFNYGVVGSDIWLLEMEPNGTVVWQKFYGEQYYERILNSRSLLIKDNFIYISGGGVEDSIFTDPTTVGWLIKTDMQGNLIWDKKFVRGLGIDYFRGVQNWDNETLILGGTIQDYSLDNEVAPSAWLMKIDTAGNIIWERTIRKYGYVGVHHYVFDMLVSSDKGILIGGYVIANSVVDENGYYHRNDAWLAKTDSCGYTVGDIPKPNILVDSIVKRTVYLSEKSKEYCTAELTWDDGTQDTTYYAYENNLPLVKKQFVHTFQENGTYIIKTTTLAGEEYRETELKVRINYQDSIITEPEPIYGLLSVFPNPTKDILTIQNPISQTQDLEFFSIELYTINGKKLQTYNLDANLYHQQINVAKLSNGVYYLKFVINKEIKETVKLVIARV